MKKKIIIAFSIVSVIIGSLHVLETQASRRGYKGTGYYNRYGNQNPSWGGWKYRWNNRSYWDWEQRSYNYTAFRPYKGDENRRRDYKNRTYWRIHNNTNTPISISSSDEKETLRPDTSARIYRRNNFSFTVRIQNGPHKTFKARNHTIEVHINKKGKLGISSKE